MRYRLRTLLILLAIGPPGLALLAYFVTGYHDRYTCVLCRADRVDCVYWDHKWGTAILPAVCTQWYDANVEPAHDHIWVRASATAVRNLYGRRFGVIDRDLAGRAIWALTPDDQVAIYEHLPANDRKRTFLPFADPAAAASREDYELLRSLENWKQSGFKSPAPSVPP